MPASSSTVPLLAPHQDKLRQLMQFPRERLLAFAQRRGLEVSPRASRQTIAYTLARWSFFVLSEQQYREQGTSFDARDDAYEAICRIMRKARFANVVDVGCGPGFLAAAMQRARVLPPDGSYVGFDHSPAAIELAKQRCGDDRRFEVFVADAESMDAKRAKSVDVVVISFVLSYLDTRAVARLMRTLARTYPRASMIISLTFTSCVDRLDGVQPAPRREIRAARSYLAGDARAARELWDVRRYECYRAAVKAHYRIEEQRLLANARLIWVARPRNAKHA